MKAVERRRLVVSMRIDSQSESKPPPTYEVTELDLLIASTTARLLSSRPPDVVQT